MFKEALNKWLYAERPRVMKSRRSVFLRLGLFRRLRLAMLRAMRTEVTRVNREVMRFFRGMVTMQRHLSDRASCHPEGKLTQRCVDVRGSL